MEYLKKYSWLQFRSLGLDPGHVHLKKSSIGECDVQAGSRIVAKDIISTVTERCEVKRG